MKESFEHNSSEGKTPLFYVPARAQYELMKRFKKRAEGTSADWVEQNARNFRDIYDNNPDIAANLASDNEEDKERAIVEVERLLAEMREMPGHAA